MKLYVIYRFNAYEEFLSWYFFREEQKELALSEYRRMMAEDKDPVKTYLLSFDPISFTGEFCDCEPSYELEGNHEYGFYWECRKCGNQMEVNKQK